jgi:hypothetical protein
MRPPSVTNWSFGADSSTASEVSTHGDAHTRRALTRAQTVLVGADRARGLAGALGQEIAADEGEVAEELARLGVGGDEGEEGAEVLDGLVAVGAGLFGGDGGELGGVLLGAVDVDVAGVPDEVLEELVRVLLADHRLRRLDDVARVLDQLAAIGGQRGLVD